MSFNLASRNTIPICLDSVLSARSRYRKESYMSRLRVRPSRSLLTGMGTLTALLAVAALAAQPDRPAQKRDSSFSPVVITEPFDAMMARKKRAKSDLMRRHLDFLKE